MNTPDGYQPAFITQDLVVKWPTLKKPLQSDIFKTVGNKTGELKYHHYSVVLSKSRRFARVVGVNIDGETWKQINRDQIFPGGSDKWTEDERAKDASWGRALYEAPDSKFDRGHLVKREDPQWGADEETARQAAQSTFSYTNSVPQVADLNQKAWRKLEDYILKNQSAKHHLRVCVFTGPVLDKDNPVFVHPVNGIDVQLPTHFWKVIYFTNDGKKLRRVAFMMGQKQLMRKNGLIRRAESELESFPTERGFFEDFKDSQTYQVSVQTIESMTGLKFMAASEPKVDKQTIDFILSKTDLETFRLPSDPDDVDYELKGIVF